MMISQQSSQSHKLQTISATNQTSIKGNLKSLPKSSTFYNQQFLSRANNGKITGQRTGSNPNNQNLKTNNISAANQTLTLGANNQAINTINSTDHLSQGQIQTLQKPSQQVNSSGNQIIGLASSTKKPKLSASRQTEGAFAAISHAQNPGSGGSISATGVAQGFQNQRISSLKGVRKALKSPQNQQSQIFQQNLQQQITNQMINSIKQAGIQSSVGITNQKKINQTNNNSGSQAANSKIKQNQNNHAIPQRYIDPLQLNVNLVSNNEESLQLRTDRANPSYSNNLDQNQDKATLPLGIKTQPLTSRNLKHQSEFFSQDLQDLEDYYAADKDLEVKLVNERAASIFNTNQNNNNKIQEYQDKILINQASPFQESGTKVMKRVSLHSNKRGRNQPSQNSNHILSPSQNNNNQYYHQVINNPALRLSPTPNSASKQQMNHAAQEIMIVNLSKRDDSYYGNDQDIYEMERLGNVMLLNQVKLKEESSLSMINDSNALLNNDILGKIDETTDNHFKLSQSYLKNMLEQDYNSNMSINEMRFSNKFQTQPSNKANKFAPVEQELDDSVSRINQSDFKNNPFLFQQRSLSLSSYNHNMSHQQSTYQRKTTQIKRPDSQSPLQDFKSISSGKIMRRDSSTGHLFESPSERTMLDVLGLCSSTTHKNYAKESVHLSIIPFNNQNSNAHIILGQDLSDIFQVEGLVQQQSLNNGNQGQNAILMQSQYQNMDFPSRMPSLMFMNQSSSSQNPQILFNNHPGCNGSYTGDSFSTNKIVNNFLDEKRKELEALQEQDRESDTTEQMTFSQNSRDASQDSIENQQNQQDQIQSSNQLLNQDEVYLKQFSKSGGNNIYIDRGSAASGVENHSKNTNFQRNKITRTAVQDQELNELYGQDGSGMGGEYQLYSGDLEFNKDLGDNYESHSQAEEGVEDGQRRTLRRTSRIFEYYNKSKKDSLSKKKRKRRITSTNGNNNLLSAQSCTRGSNIQMMSIRDILLDKDSQAAQTQQQQQHLQIIQQQKQQQHILQNHQLFQTPDEIVQNKVDSSSLVEPSQNFRDEINSQPKLQRPAKYQRQTQSSFLNRKFSENPSSLQNLRNFNQNLNNQTGDQIKSSPTVYNLQNSSKQNSVLKDQQQFNLSDSNNEEVLLSLGLSDVGDENSIKKQLTKARSNGKLNSKVTQNPTSNVASNQKSRNYLFSQTILTSAQQTNQDDSQFRLNSLAAGGNSNPMLMSDNNIANKNLYTPIHQQNQEKIQNFRALIINEKGEIGQHLNSDNNLSFHQDELQLETDAPNTKKMNLSQGRKNFNKNSNQIQINTNSLSRASNKNFTLSSAKQNQFQSDSSQPHLKQQQASCSNKSATKLRIPQSTHSNQIKSEDLISKQSQGVGSRASLINSQQNKRKSQLLGQKDKNSKMKLNENEIKAQEILADSYLQQQIAVETLPKSNNGSLRLENQQCYSQSQVIILQQNRDHQINQAQSAQFVVQLESELNRTAPEDLSMSYMNIGNSTVDMKDQNAANIKTFDFRPSKQIIK